MDNSVFICGKVIESYDEEADAKDKSERETKIFQQILMKRKQHVKRKIYVFYLLFY